MQPLFFVIIAVVFDQAMAFPQMMFEMAKNQGLSVEDIAATVTLAHVEKRDTFDPSQQLISTSGAYAFVPPSSTDLRGPCPGLNALANHNYLPHNGLATLTQYAQATNQGVSTFF